MSAVKTTLEARTLRPDLRNFKAPFVSLNTSRFTKTNSTLLVLERGDGEKGCGTTDRGQSEQELLIIRRRDWGGESKIFFFGLPPSFLMASLLARR